MRARFRPGPESRGRMMNRLKIRIFIWLLFGSMVFPSMSWAAYTVTQMKYINAMAGTNGAIIPARVVNTAAIMQAGRWVALNLPRASLGALVGAAVFAAGTAGVDYLMSSSNSFLAKNYWSRVNGVISENQLPTNYTFPYNPQQYLGTYTGGSAAYAAVEAAKAAWGCGVGYSGVGSCVASSISYYGPGYWASKTTQVGANPASYESLYVWAHVGTPVIVPVELSVVQSAVTSELENDYTSVAPMVGTALQAVSDAYEGKNNIDDDVVIWPVVQGIVNSMISAAQIEAVDTIVAVPDDYVDRIISGVQDREDQAKATADALAGVLTGVGGLSQAETTAAVKAAIDDATGVTIPDDVTVDVPTKKDLTGVLGAFMTAVEGMPVISTLRGLTINVSGGTSTLCVNLPSNLGGSSCFNAGAMQEALNMIGSIMLGLVTVFSFVSVFRG